MLCVVLQTAEKQDLFKAAIVENLHVYLTVCSYKDEMMVHIRENGLVFPTKKGMSFSKRRWGIFTTHVVTVVKDVKCVNIRHYFHPPKEQKEIPTRSRIALRLGEWDALMKSYIKKFPS